ncbi:hypothetical protein GJ496_009682 [Pomphorhynchus laevis]|nr:hypothetical protein GJ496_009682 [Pomphorhynchus laevis]
MMGSNGQLTVDNDSFYYNRVNAIDINSDDIIIATRTKGILSYDINSLTNDEHNIHSAYTLKSNFSDDFEAYDILCNVNQDLIYACTHSGQVFIWQRNMEEQTHPKLISTINVSSSQLNRVQLWSNNRIILGSESDGLFHVDCQSGNVISLTNNKPKMLGSVLDMKTSDENIVWTVGELGFIFRWDIRMSSCEKIICPNEIPSLQRKERWLGCLAVTENWLATGGGPKLAIFDQRFIKENNFSAIEDDDIFPVVAIFDYAETGINLVAGGWSRHGHIKRYNLDGTICERSLSTSMAPIQALQIKRNPYKLMVVGGNANAIDIFFNFNYKSLTLNFN